MSGTRDRDKIYIISYVTLAYVVLFKVNILIMRLPWGVLVVKNPPASAGDIRDMGSILGLRKIPWRRAWQPTTVFLPGESHGQRSLSGYSSLGYKELDRIKVT